MPLQAWRPEFPMSKIDDIVENFTLLDEWDDRYRYVIELGRALPPMPESAHTDANKVQGCASQVWLTDPCRAGRRRRPGHDLQRRQRRPYRARAGRHSDRALFRQRRARDPRHRRARVVRPHRPAREPDAAALERFALDGRARPRRSQRRAGRRLKRRAHSTTKPAPSASQVRIGARAWPLACAA